MNTTNDSKHKRVRFSSDPQQTNNRDVTIIDTTLLPATSNIRTSVMNKTTSLPIVVVPPAVLPMTAAQQKLSLLTMQTLCNHKRTFDVNDPIEVITRLDALRRQHTQHAARLATLTFRQMVGLVQADIMNDFASLSNIETAL